MGSSAFEPVVLADVRSVKNKIDLSGLTSDVIAIGDVIRYDASSDTYLRAKADNDTNANFIGVVENISGTDFTIVYSGEISLPNSVMSLVSGFTGAQVFYLSDTDAGKLTTTAPSNPGHVIKPVIITKGFADDTDDVDGIVVNSTGTNISGDSIVDLSDIQPVGSILAFAGNTGQIPTGWDICDGGFLSVTTYSDLYTALNDGKIYGFIQNVNLTKIATSGSGILTNDNFVGSVFYVAKAATPDSVLKFTLLSGTVSGSSITNAEVFVEPAYVLGSLAGAYHNTLLEVGDACQAYSGDTNLDVSYTVSSTTGKTHFRKPDMRARFVVGSSRGLTGVEDTGFDSYTIGNNGGEEYHTLTVNEMPIHAHGITLSTFISGSVSTSHNLTTDTAGSHIHDVQLESAAPNGEVGLGLLPAFNYFGSTQVPAVTPGSGQGGAAPNNVIAVASGSHNHIVSGTISVSTTDLTPGVAGEVYNEGGDIAHNNVPQYIVMYWIIKTRKDSYAKIYKLGPSGGGAIVAKNTAKRWVRATSGTGCTTDIGYGTWGITRAAKGNYVFTHDLLTDLGATGATQYIVEATVTKSGSGLTQMFVANSYNLGGVTFGVQIWDIIGATHSDNFQYLNVTVYGGGTAI